MGETVIEQVKQDEQVSGADLWRNVGVLEVISSQNNANMLSAEASPPTFLNL